jgi:hypothetical protein
VDQIVLPVLAHSLVNVAAFVGIHRPDALRSLAPGSATAWILGGFLLAGGIGILRRAGFAPPTPRP